MATQTHMMTTPYWMESSLPRFPKLERDARVDVVVVGGGITGLTAAYLIAKGGRSVALLERGRCAEIDTGHTTAHLTMVTDLRLAEFVDSVRPKPCAGRLGRRSCGDRPDRHDRQRRAPFMRVHVLPVH